jgi:DNA-binding GntR family transcriptional regulator
VSGEIKEKAALLRAIAGGDAERASALTLEAVSAFESNGPQGYLGYERSKFIVDFAKWGYTPP